MAFALDFLLVSSLYRVVYNSFIWYFVSSGVVLFQESEKTVKIVLFMAALAALSNRAGHYIFALWFLSIFFYLLSFFLAESHLSSHRLDVYHNLTHGVALVQI